MLAVTVLTSLNKTISNESVWMVKWRIKSSDWRY